MKKIFTLIALALAIVAGAQAQTITINKVDGSKVTYNADSVLSIEFGAKSDTVVQHSFGPGSAYLLVSSKWFQNSYYGQNSTMTVLTVGDETLAKFEDPTWGTGLFNITMGKGHTISGTGTLSMPNPHGGEARNYTATMSGSMMSIQINVPDVMGGTTINWIFGDPGAYKYAGNYEGTDTMSVTAMGQTIGSFPANNASVDTLVARTDSTLDITFPETTYSNVTMMGNVTMGSYTIKDLKWDATKKAYYRDYHNDGISFHFKSDSRDQDYKFTDAACQITVTFDENGKSHVVNSFVLGNMPGVITQSTTGTKK